MCRDSCALRLFLLALALLSPSFCRQSACAEIAELQKEYADLEHRFNTWLLEPAGEASQQASLAAEFKQMADSCAGIAERSNSSVGERIQARFWGAWSRYYGSVLNTAASRITGFERARTDFEEFLGIRDVAADQWTSELLGLAAEGNRIGLRGLAFADIATQNDARSDACFELLNDPGLPRDQRREISVWRLRGSLYAGRSELALEYLDDLKKLREQDRPESATAVCCMAAYLAFRARPVVDRTVGVESLETLLGWGKSAYVRKVLSDLPLVLNQGSDRLQLHCGITLARQAYVAGDHQAYRTALATLMEPLKRFQGRGADALVLEARVLAALLNYQLDQYAESAREAKHAIDLVVEERRLGKRWRAYTDEAAKAAGIRIAAVLQTIDSQSSEQQRELAAVALREIQENAELFGQQNADTAAYHLARLRINHASREEMLTWLRQVSPENKMYSSALYDIAIVLYQAWREAPDEARAAAFGELKTAAAEYWRKSERNEDPARDFRLMVRMAEANLGTSGLDPQATRSFLETSAGILAAHPQGVTQESMIQFHYINLLLAERTDDGALVVGEADWLAKNAIGTPFEEYAVDLLCRRWRDHTLDGVDSDDLTNVLRWHLQLLDCYRTRASREETKLFDRAGAEYLASRSAEIAERIGRHKEAARLLDELLQESPNKVEFLRRAGRAHHAAKVFAKSADHWRTLLELLEEPKDGGMWYEAKYYLIDCLGHIDAARAREVLDQCLTLYSPIRFPDWRRRFAQLDESLAK